MITLRFTYDRREQGAWWLFDTAARDLFFDPDPRRGFYPVIDRHRRLRFILSDRWAERKKVREKRYQSGGRVHAVVFRTLSPQAHQWVVTNCRGAVTIWSSWGRVGRHPMKDACVMVTFYHDSDAVAFEAWWPTARLLGK